MEYTRGLIDSVLNREVITVAMETYQDRVREEQLLYEVAVDICSDILQSVTNDMIILSAKESILLAKRERTLKHHQLEMCLKRWKLRQYWNR